MNPLSLIFVAAMGGQPVILNVPAPELKEITDWVNSKPAMLADHRGKVVVMHFWTFGCINCIRNMPHYNGWHNDFANKGVTVLGVHTPEFTSEEALPRIKAKAKEFGVRYPVAVDNRKQTWRAWGNRYWPSVYLIDKRGKARYRWDGEMNFGGVEGEKLMRAKIEELLREPAANE